MIIKTQKGNEWNFTVTGVDIFPTRGMKINGIRKTGDDKYEEISVSLSIVELAAVATSIMSAKDEIEEACKKL